MIHTNELPLRHLITELDGPTNSRDGFTGPIGKLIKKVHSFPISKAPPALKSTSTLIQLPEDVITNLSTDQKNCYWLVQAINSGSISKELSNLKCGPLNHSRWLTTAEALLFLWISDHGLEGDVLIKFELIVGYLLDSYFKLYFDIKVMNSLIYGPQHILESIRIYRKQPKAVQDIIKNHIVRGAFHAHPENILLCLLASQDEEDRVFAVDTILKIRGESEYGDKSVRPHKTPRLNFDCDSVRSLIYWDEITCYEPIFTCEMSKQQLNEIKKQPKMPPNYPIHTQSTERAVQEVSKASSAVFGQEKRDGYVRARIAHREIVPIFHSKQDILKNF